MHADFLDLRYDLDAAEARPSKEDGWKEGRKYIERRLMHINSSVFYFKIFYAYIKEIANIYKCIDYTKYVNFYNRYKPFTYRV